MYDIIFDSIFTQVPKSFNSTVALQVCFLKHLGDVVLHSSSGISLSVCSVSSFIPDRLDDDEIRFLCGANKNLTELLQLTAK